MLCSSAMLIRSALNLVIVGGFLAIGFLVGPFAQGAYNHFFPEPAYVTGDYDSVIHEARKAVVMFSTSTCPHCRDARTFFSANQIEYADFVIDTSQDAMQQFTSLGGDGVPLIFIGNRKITGFREEIVRESLAAAKIPGLYRDTGLKHSN